MSHLAIGLVARLGWLGIGLDMDPHQVSSVGIMPHHAAEQPLAVDRRLQVLHHAVGLGQRLVEPLVGLLDNMIGGLVGR